MDCSTPHNDLLALPPIVDLESRAVLKACMSARAAVCNLMCAAQALWANDGNTIGEQALRFSTQLYQVEREVAETDSEAQCEARRRRSRPVADALRPWMRQQRQKISDGSTTAKAIDHSLNRWAALTLHRRWRAAHRQQLGREQDPGCSPVRCAPASGRQPS